MVYANYDYYQNTYLGKLSEDFFNSLIIKASREIDKNVNTELTETKIEGLTEEAQDKLKYTACALIDLIYIKQESKNRKITSFTIDGVKKDFKTFSNDEYKHEKDEILECLPIEITRYL